MTIIKKFWKEFTRQYTAGIANHTGSLEGRWWLKHRRIGGRWIIYWGIETG